MKGSHILAVAGIPTGKNPVELDGVIVETKSPYLIIFFPNSLIRYCFSANMVLFIRDHKRYHFATCHIALPFFARKLIISPSVPVSLRHIVGKKVKTNARFNHSAFRFNLQRVSFRNDLTMLYSFIKQFLPYLVPLWK